MISKDSSEKFCNFADLTAAKVADLIAAISLISSKQRFDRYDLIRSKNTFRTCQYEMRLRFLVEEQQAGVRS